MVLEGFDETIRMLEGVVPLARSYENTWCIRHPHRARLVHEGACFVHARAHSVHELPLVVLWSTGLASSYSSISFARALACISILLEHSTLLLLLESIRHSPPSTSPHRFSILNLLDRTLCLPRLLNGTSSLVCSKRVGRRDHGSARGH